MRRDYRSPEAAQYRALYKTKAWKALRLSQLTREPLCRMCKEQGNTTAATIVDHRSPHKGDVGKFFDPSNLQSLCPPHHNGAKQSEERTGIAKGCDTNGWPLDPGHHWHS